MPMPNFSHYKLRRIKGTLNWVMNNDEPFLTYAGKQALDWMHREFDSKKRVKGGLINKACGILAENLFRSILDELNVPHVATEPMLSKGHPVNVHRIYDFMLADGTTIDIKSLPPQQYSEKINLNQQEAEEIGVCDWYGLYACTGDFKQEEIEIMLNLCDKQSAELAEILWSGKADVASELDAVITDAQEYIDRIKSVSCVGWVKGKYLVKPENLITRKAIYGPYFSLTIHRLQGKLSEPFISPEEFTEKILKVKLGDESDEK
jgi:hypothetical protein